ncbi:MAG: LacI family DNA-binding transcriptional regulator [Methylobacteriaceae bacterium]|nr:LacI family DNA-binding transcriptional regulator [Methylobacteriaceae bacterium]
MSRPETGGRRKPAKIADVARIAEVSVATVSRTLANPEVVAEETRKRVLAAVTATGYTPNLAGRALRARRSMLALVVVPDLANPFFPEVLRGVDETLSAAGYGIIIANLDNSAEKESRYVDLACAGQVDGVLLLCGHVIRGRVRDLRASGLPIVAACERIDGEDIPQVEVDNEDAAARAVAHLIDLGHRRIGYIAGPERNVLDRDRRKGFGRALRAARLDPRKAPAFAGDFTFRAGERAARDWLAMPDATRPSAIFAANDEMAIGFVKTARAAGARVPDDVSIVGFDGIEFADYCEPTLTTIYQPRRDIGATAAALLIAAMTSPKPPSPRFERIATRLMLRDSTAAAPKR